MSKFDYGTFFGGYDVPKNTKIAITNAFVRHRVGWNEDNERCCGWWLEYKEHSRSCPVYAFHEVLSEMPRKLESEYEWIDVKGGAE